MTTKTRVSTRSKQPPIELPPTLGPYVCRWIERNLVHAEGDYFGQQFKLRQWQRRFVWRAFELNPDGSRRYNRVVLGLPKGNGKGLWVGEWLMTQRGWQRAGEINELDDLYGRDGSRVRITGIYPQGVVPLYRMSFADGSTLVVDGPHRWAVQERDSTTAKWDSGWQVLSTEDILRCGVSWSNGKWTNYRYRVPVPEPVRYDGVDFEDEGLDPYMVGCWIGDGHIRKSDAGITSEDEDLLAQCMYTVRQDLVTIDRYANRAPQLRFRKPIRDRLAALGFEGVHAAEKFIPDRYLQADVDVRLALLQGLLDTDGSISKAGEIEFTTISRQLSADAGELIRSLGGFVTSDRARTTKYTHNGEVRNGRLSHRLILQLPDHIIPFRLQRKRARLREREPGWRLPKWRQVVDVAQIDDDESVCFTVDAPDSLFLAGRGFIPTHNTELAAALACCELDGPVVVTGWKDGKPIPGRRLAPDIPVAAASFDQANLLFGAARTMILEGPLSQHFDVFDTEITPKTGPGRMYRVAAVAGTNDGRRPTFFLADEVHEWCLGLGTPVAMADGTLRRVEDVCVDDLVLAWNERIDALEPAPVVCSRANGTRPILSVETRRGRRVIVTANHRFWAQRVIGLDTDGCDVTEESWCRADELQLTDRLRVGLGWTVPGGDFNHGYLLGALVGDGGLTTDTVGWTAVDPAIVSYMRSLVAVYGCTLQGEPPRYRLTRGAFMGSSHNALRTMLAEHSLLGRHSHEKFVPLEIMQAGRESWLGFLSGYLDSDGHVSPATLRQPRVRWASTSRLLLEGCQHLLTLLEVQSDLRSRGLDTRKASYRESYELRVGGRNQLRRLAALLRPVGAKAERLQAIAKMAVPQKLGTDGSQRRMFAFDRIKAIMPLPDMETWGLEVEGLHTHVTGGLVSHNTGNKERVFLVLSNGRAKREDSWELAISTAGWDMASLLGRMYKHGKAVLAGEEKDPRLLFEWHEPADSELDISDETALEAAIRESNPAAGDFLPIENVIDRASEIPEFEFRRYHLNQWSGAPDRWLPQGAWEKCADDREPPADGTEIVIGFDGSYSSDSTAVVGATVEKVPHVFVIQAWERPDGAKNWRVDIPDVEQEIRNACGRWQVHQVGCDPFRWQRSLAVLEEEGFPIIEWPSHVPSRMVPACAQFYDGVVNDGLTHDGDERLAKHIANSIVKIDSRGPRITKDHKDSERHIDLAVAAVLAYDLAVRAISDEGAWRPL